MENDSETLTDREKWCIEKVDFVMSVVSNVTREFIWQKIATCSSNKDVSILVQKLLKYYEEDEDDDSEDSAKCTGAVGHPRHTHSHSTTAPYMGTVDDNEEGDRVLDQVLTLKEIFPDVDEDYLLRRCGRARGDSKAYYKFVEELLRERETRKQNFYENSEDFDIAEQISGERDQRSSEQEKCKSSFAKHPMIRTQAPDLCVGNFAEQTIRRKTSEPKFYEDEYGKHSRRTKQWRTEELNFPDNDTNIYSKDRKTCEKKSYKEERTKPRERSVQMYCADDYDNHRNRQTIKDVYPNDEFDNQSRSKRDKHRSNSQKYDNHEQPRRTTVKKSIYSNDLTEDLRPQYTSHFKDKNEEETSGIQERDCEICCEEVLVSNMIACNSELNKHKFCRICVKKFVEEEIGQGRVTFRCIEMECRGQISTKSLKSLVTDTVFNSLMQRQQHEELANAGIDDLLQCPFCDFMMILPDKKDVVFLCQNPECLKDSCRFCREMNHFPQTCEEVKADKQKDVRTMLENRMAEAMIRVCSKCRKRFIKEAGCNMMTCACGAKMCYLCKQSIQGYDHFGPAKCQLHSDAEAVHGEEVKKAAADAKQGLDPNLEIIHDPTKDVLL